MGNYLSTSNKESMQVINEPDHVRVIMSTSEENQEKQENQENQEKEEDINFMRDELTEFLNRQI